MSDDVRCPGCGGLPDHVVGHGCKLEDSVRALSIGGLPIYRTREGAAKDGFLDVEFAEPERFDGTPRLFIVLRARGRNPRRALLEVRDV